MLYLELLFYNLTIISPCGEINALKFERKEEKKKKEKEEKMKEIKRKTLLRVFFIRVEVLLGEHNWLPTGRRCEGLTFPATACATH